jgi:hypothetical protein
LLAQSVFHRFNLLIGKNYPRIRHVLWLTNDTTLRDAGHSELHHDPEEVKFIIGGPTVHYAKGFDDIDAGHNGSDIKIATVQSVWKVELDGGDQRHTEEEIHRALLHYDTIVFDECDWGNDHVRLIAQIASHALQLSLTASPPIFEISGSEEKARDFQRRFVLITEKAIADYTRAVRLDSCLKLLTKDIVIAAKHPGFTDRERGIARDQTGTMKPDHVLWVGAVCDAVIRADQLETKMRLADPDNYFSPHMMVRLPRVPDIKSMINDLNRRLEDLYHQGRLANEGWIASMIFAGHDRLVEANERDLSRRNGKGDWLHPFMMARNNSGRVMPGSKRILLMCNIGVRGINNWAVSFIVDCTESESPVELIQFVHGRPLRWKGPENWLNENSEFNEFAQTYVYIPTSPYQDDKKSAIIEWRQFVEDMLARIGGAGFLSWRDLLDGRRTTDADVTIDPSNRPVSDVERFQVQQCLGAAIVNGGEIANLGKQITEAQQKVMAAKNKAEREAALEELSGITKIVSPTLIEPMLGPAIADVPPRLRQRFVDYATRLITKPNFRKREITLDPTRSEFKRQPANVMEKLKPQEKYETDDLVRWVRAAPQFDGMRDDFVQEIVEGRRTTIKLISNDLRDTQVAHYRTPSRTRNLQDKGGERGVLPEVSTELIGTLRKADQPCDAGAVMWAMNNAANIVFQIEAGNGGPMDHPAYHIAILGRYRDVLQNLARATLISNGLLGPSLKSLADL